jgi:hypothetical protein
MTAQPMKKEGERAAVLFNGTYTIENRATGEHRTLRVATRPKDAKVFAGKRVIALLTGPDSYTGFGFVSDTGIQVWKKQRRQSAEQPPTMFESLAFMLWDLAVKNGERYGARYALLMQGTCLICNRELTTPESIRRGIGPVCAEQGS